MNFLDLIFQNPLAKLFIIFLKSVKVHNKQISLHSILVQFIKDFRFDDLLIRAEGMAFNFTLAIFPGIIFLFSLIPYIPIDNLQVDIMKFIGEIMPESSYKVASETIFDIISKQRGGVLSFGFILTLYAATSGTMSMMEALNKTFKMPDRRNFLQKRGTATLMTFTLSFILFLSILIHLLGNTIMNFLLSFELLNNLKLLRPITILRYIITISLFFTSISLIYYFAPHKSKHWKFFSLGAIVATTFTFLITVIFSFYLENFATYNKLYGSIGTLIGLMLWLYMVSIILLFGFGFNCAIDNIMNFREKRVKDTLPKNRLKTDF
jgi:membrane protein